MQQILFHCLIKDRGLRTERSPRSLGRHLGSNEKSHSISRVRGGSYPLKIGEDTGPSRSAQVAGLYKRTGVVRTIIGRRLAKRKSRVLFKTIQAVKLHDHFLRGSENEAVLQSRGGGHQQ